MSITSERSQLVFRKAEHALRKLSSGQDAERVHRFRTTVRRLQTMLEELSPERDRNQKKLLKILERVRKRAGKVRDLDVQLTALRSLKILPEPRRKTRLTHGLIELRLKHENKLRKILTRNVIREVRKRLKRASKEAGLETSRDPLAIARQMLAQVEFPAEPLTEDVMHQFRTAVKRARYAAEFAPKSAEASQFIAELKRLQDAIGSWHDWLTLTHSAGTRLGDVSESSLVATLHNVTGSKFRHAVAALSASPAFKGVLRHTKSTEQSRRLNTHAPTRVVRTDVAA
jgi:CHAD domain-containing protein